MTDRYVFNPDIHEDWTPPAHRCGNCAHHEHEVVEVERIAKDGSELTDDERPLGKMTLDEVLDVIAENPHRFIEQYEVYREEVIRLGGKL